MSPDPDRELMESLRPPKEYFRQGKSSDPRKPMAIFGMIGCGGIIALFSAVGIATTCSERSAAKAEAARTAVIEAKRKAAADAAEAAFSAIPPAQHLAAANKTMGERKTAEVSHHLSKIPAGFPGLDAAKSRLAKLESDLKAERIAKEKREAAAREAKEKMEAAKQLAEWRKKGVTIGMTAERVRLSNWGRPDHINRTIRSSGVREQWVYDGGYLYFEDGILTAIQN